MNYKNLTNIIKELYNQIKSKETELNEIELNKIEGIIGLLVEECSKAIISQDINLIQLTEVSKKLKYIYEKLENTKIKKLYLAGRISTLYDIITKIILVYNTDNFSELVEYKDLLVKISKKNSFEDILFDYQDIYDKNKMIEILYKLRAKNLIFIYELPNTLILKITPIGNDIMCFFNEISNLPTYPFKVSKP